MPNQEKSFTVQVESDLEELIPGFMKNRYLDVEKIENLLQKEDFDAIELVGHTMKGNGAGYGFEEISEFGKAIEEAATEKQSLVIRKLLTDLSSYLDHIDIEYV